MQYDSPFVEPFSQFVIQIYQAGLLPYWEYWTFEQAVTVGMVKRIIDVEPNTEATPMTLENLALSWLILGLGIGLAVSCFIAEIFMHNQRYRILYINKK